jgi:putative membrane protein
MNDRPGQSAKAAARTTAELARSARAVERSTTELSEDADRRTALAGDRTLLATERTYAAWVRTGLAALAGGIGARAVFEKLVPEPLARLTATVLIVFAAFCFVIGVWRQLRDPVPPPRTDSRPVSHRLLIAMNAFLLLVTLAALVGVWAA